MFEGLLQPSHLILILVVVLIVFGPGKLPELGQAIGKGIREFKDSVRPGAPADETQQSQTVQRPAASAALPAPTCSHCGAAVHGEQRFCSECGTAIAQTAAADTVAPTRPA